MNSVGTNHFARFNQNGRRVRRTQQSWPFEVRLVPNESSFLGAQSSYNTPHDFLMNGLDTSSDLFTVQAVEIDASGNVMAPVDIGTIRMQGDAFQQSSFCDD